VTNDNYTISATEVTSIPLSNPDWNAQVSLKGRAHQEMWSSHTSKIPQSKFGRAVL